MVKNKSGRDMNPADAFRKVQRQKEILRNKKERTFQRDAAKLRSDPEKLKDELREVIGMQEAHEGKVNLSVRLKKKALQSALDTSIKNKRVRPRPRYEALGALHRCIAPLFRVQQSRSAGTWM